MSIKAAKAKADLEEGDDFDHFRSEYAIQIVKVYNRQLEHAIKEGKSYLEQCQVDFEMPLFSNVIAKVVKELDGFLRTEGYRVYTHSVKISPTYVSRWQLFITIFPI